jgi:cell wall-associated NlpC family hydrolase
MFSSDPNTTGIRTEYSSIATGNVTTTIDNLHTAQNQLQATQAALQQQESTATTTRDNLQASESQAANLGAQYKSTLASVNANIQNLVAQQQAQALAAAKQAATNAFNAKVAAAQRSQAAAQTVAQTTTGGGSGAGAAASVPTAPPPPVPPGVGGAIQAAMSQRGVAYVWGGETPGVGFDCSGLVQWSFAQAGISLPRTSGAQYAATTHIPLADIEPGDLLFYGPDGSEHVALYIGGGSMIEAPYTGAVVWVTGVRTGDGFAGVGRVG